MWISPALTAVLGLQDLTKVRIWTEVSLNTLAVLSLPSLQSVPVTGLDASWGDAYIAHCPSVCVFSQCYVCGVHIDKFSVCLCEYGDLYTSDLITIRVSTVWQ